MTIDVNFIDSGRTATQPSNPKFPNGQQISVAEPGQKSCTFNLPYPAPGCGTYSIVCSACRFTALVTVAGRADDPRVLTLPCKAPVH